VTHSSKAIVISKESFGEADCYVQFYTEEWGMLTALAKSAKKSKRRYVGGLDLFCHDEIFLRGEPRDKAYLQELTVLNSFSLLREDLDKLLHAGKVTQWVKKLGNFHSPAPLIYRLLGQTLALIEKESDLARLNLLTLVFKLKLLSQLGLKPSVEACVRCTENLDGELYFDLEAGGILCARCSGKSPLNQYLRLIDREREFLHVADQLRLSSWDQIHFPLEHTNHLQKLVQQFAAFHTHTRLLL